MLVFFPLLLFVIDLSQRRRHRHLVWMREKETVAFALRERGVWETAWITANESSVVFDSVQLAVSNFRQRPGLRMVVDGVLIDEFWLLRDRHGVFWSRLEGADEQHAADRLLAGR